MTKYMTTKLAATLLLGVALIRFADVAIAADFYVLNFSKEEENAVIIDPLSVTDTRDHHKTAHIISIVAHGTWNDETMEFDCAGKRWKSLSSISHMAGVDSVDHATEGGTVPAWEAIDPTSVVGHESDIVCKWPDIKAHLELYQSADLLTAKRAISELLNN